jgi:hypothetical protein
VSEQHVPSLVDGLQRFWKPVLAVLVAAAVVGFGYAVATWNPTVTMTVGVEVATTPGSTNVNSNDAARSTSEVAASLSSPAVVARAESISGANLDSVSSVFDQQSSTVDLVVGAASVGAAESGAAALIPAYDQVTAETAQAASDAAVAAIDDTLGPLLVQQTTVGNDLAGTQSNSGAYAQLNTQYQSLTAQIEELNKQRSEALLSATAKPVNVDVVSEPAASSSRLSAIIRYVPVAVVGALILCLLAIGVYVRRRPWVTSPEVAADVLGASLLAVGPDDVSPVVGLGILHDLPDAIGLALVLPVGTRTEAGLDPDLVARSDNLVDRIARGLTQAGSPAVAATVDRDGRCTVTTANRSLVVLDSLWADGTNTGDGVVSLLAKRGVGTDVVLVVPDASLDQGTLLSLVELSDTIVVVVRNGEWLEPLATTRRELRSLGRDPLGVVVDPPA